MINLNTTDLNNLTKEELINLAVNELNEYKEAREIANLSSNIRQVKILEALEKRLQGHSLVDEEALLLRREINGVLNEDVHKKTSTKRETLSNYEVMQNYYNNFR